MGSRNRKRRKFDGVPNYWQSADYNSTMVQIYQDMFLGLMINRFRWVGLPEGCDEWFLERQLHLRGMATICHPEGMPELWQSLICNPDGGYNHYGYPVRWRAQGYAGDTEYRVTPDNGEVVYYSKSRQNPWNAIYMFALKMAHYSRTEDVNLSHQHKPWVLTAPQEKQLELTNLLKQIEGGEPAILGTSKFKELAQNITVIDTGVPLVTEDLARCQQNVLNQFLLYAGIPHLAFEKGERMIEDEARANSAPTNLMLLDCLSARRMACRKLNKRFGLEIDVYFNDDFESYNFNYLNNAESLAQDGLMGGAENGEPELR